MDKLKSAFSSLVVIVAGVLIALAGDAAWEGRAEAVREQEILADLLEEFQENRALLRMDMEANGRARSAGGAWAEAMTSGRPPTSDSLRALFFALQNDARFDPVSGALRSVIDGGELHLIQGSDLRRALAGWPGHVEEARLTSETNDHMRWNLNPLALSIDPDGPLAPGERTAIALTAASAGMVNGQLEELAVQMDRIIRMIERDLSR